jgi:hypothetical protein
LSPSAALLTFSIGPVHGFIVQARRVADLWAGSGLLSHLTGEAVKEVWRQGGSMIFPYLSKDTEIPAGFPNRFVCRVPFDSAGDVARTMEAAVRSEWDDLVERTVEILRSKGLGPSKRRIWDEQSARGERQTDHLLEVAWSWVPEDKGYPEASQEGARRFALSRLFRPFSQIRERGEKCAICGERTALPDGERQHVRDKWQAAALDSDKGEDEPFLRWGQTRLCLVCATKRFYPKWHGRAGRFTDFHDFEPPKLPIPREGKPARSEELAEKFPYFAIVSMDGDRMGEVLGWSKEVRGDVERFHRDLSEALLEFTESLRSPGDAGLDLKTLDVKLHQDHRSPQLIYAGGEDVLFVCDPRDALRLAWAVRKRYLECLQRLGDHLALENLRRLTISAGILFAHTKHPAGLLFRDVEELLKRKAKGEAGRDAVAIRLAKRGGVPVETAFKWEEAAGEDEKTWVDRFDLLLGAVATGAVSSGQTFSLRRDERVLFEAFTEEAQWTAWLGDRLSRREAGVDPAGTARLLAPFFLHRKTDALRILRFLAREVR